MPYSWTDGEEKKKGSIGTRLTPILTSSTGTLMIRDRGIEQMAFWEVTMTTVAFQNVYTESVSNADIGIHAGGQIAVPKSYASHVDMRMVQGPYCA